MTDLDVFEGDLIRMESALGLPRDASEAEDTSSRPVVLVVDDDPRVLETLQHVLGSRYQVKIFSGGEDFLSRWSGEGDAAILDIKMPKEDGLSVFGDLRLRAPRMPVIFFTAYPGDEEAASRARALSPAAFLGKGCSLGELHNALRKAIGRNAGLSEEGSHV